MCLPFASRLENEDYSAPPAQLSRTVEITIWLSPHDRDRSTSSSGLAADRPSVGWLGRHDVVPHARGKFVKRPVADEEVDDLTTVLSPVSKA